MTPETLLWLAVFVMGGLAALGFILWLAKEVEKDA